MKPKLLLFVVCVSMFNLSNAQVECGTKTPSETEYSKILSRVNFNESPLLEGVKYVRVFIVDILSNSSADSAWKRNEINDEFQLAKNLLRPYNICLVLEGVEYIANSSFLDFNVANIAALQAVSNHTNCLNIYLHKTLVVNSDTLNGNAYEIGGLRLSVSRSAIGQKSMAHEIGHCFGLLHTFETSFGLECPDGSNNTTTGDQISDTRATPNNDTYINNNTNSSCIYSGNLTINCNGSNQIYNPEITNLMSYGKRTCRNNFSVNQTSLMHATILEPSVSPAITTVTPFLAINNITQNSDVVYTADILQIGNYSNTFNTTLGIEARQRYLGQQKVVITSGVKINATNRTKVIIKPTSICDETINNSF